MQHHWKPPSAANGIGHWSKELSTQRYSVLTGANPIILGWLKAKRSCKHSPVLEEWVNSTLHYMARFTQNDYPASCALSRAASAPPPCRAFQENMAAMLWTGAEGVVSRMLKANVFVRDGWTTVAHNPAQNTLPQATLRMVSLYLLLLHHRQPLRGQTDWESQALLIIHQVRMTHSGWTALRRSKRMRSRGGLVAKKQKGRKVWWGDV